MQVIQAKAILFDMDGVVVDTKASIDRFWYGAAEEYGAKITAEDMEKVVHGSPARLTIDRFFSHLSQAEKDAIVLKSDLEVETVEEIPGFMNFFSALKTWKVPFGLVTSAKRKGAEHNLRLQGILEDFPFIISADDVKQGKPHPEPYLKGMEKLACFGDEVLVFEDSPAGCRAAKAAGARVVGVNNEVLKPLLEKEKADAVVPDFTVFQIHASKPEIDLVGMDTMIRFL